MNSTKKTIVYLNPDCFVDTDLTVLKHLAKVYRVVWYYIYEANKTVSQITVEQASAYASDNGIELHVVDPKVRNRSPKNLSFYINIAREINGIKPDVVFHCNRSPYWALAVLALKCKHVVLGVHDVKLHSYKMTISRFLEKHTNGLSIKVHRYFATFSKNQQELFKRLYGRDSCLLGMSCKDFGKSSLQAPAISDGVKLLFFGSINEYKGLDLLILAMEALRSNGVSNLSLTIAGKGNSWAKCKSLIKTKEMYNLQVRFIENEEISDLMSSHHFLVLPYRDATQSGPLATAVAYELPVIAPDFGCFAETYSNESAVLYPQGYLEEALVKVARLSDKDYERLKLACKKVKELNSEEKITENYIQYFDRLLTKQQ